MTEPQRVLLIDDHAIVRTAVAHLIGTIDGIEVIADIDKEPLQAVVTLRPDITVVELLTAGVFGTRVIQDLCNMAPIQTKLLALTASESAEGVKEFLAAGGKGYVLKRSGPDELERALKTVAMGGTYLCSHATEKLREALVGQTAPPGVLTGREEEVMRLTSRGLGAKEIAQALNLSPKTVETYKARGMEKLGLKTRQDLVKYANGQGWLNPV